MSLSVSPLKGRDVVFKVGLALLEHSQEQLLQLDMEEMLKVGCLVLFLYIHR